MPGPSLPGREPEVVRTWLSEGWGPRRLPWAWVCWGGSLECNIDNNSHKNDSSCNTDNHQEIIFKVYFRYLIL